MSEEIKIRELNIQDIPDSCTWIIIGCPGSGKSTLIDNLCYYNKHKYPVCRAFIGTESGYKAACKTFHPLFVSNYFSEKEEGEYVRRQRQCSLENYKGYTGNAAINILDDVSDDVSIYKTKLIKGLFKLGSRHWNQLVVVGTQYAIDMPPEIRGATSFVAIFREPDENNRKKLFKNFGGVAGSYDRFCDLMDQLTGDYTCLIIDKRAQSNSAKDCIFYYRTVQLKPWKFGCEEYKSWGEARYDPKYVDMAVL